MIVRTLFVSVRKGFPAEPKNAGAHVFQADILQADAGMRDAAVPHRQKTRERGYARQWLLP